MCTRYKSIENISKAFATKVKPAKSKSEDAREAAIQSEIVKAKRCQEIGIGLSQARQGRFERIKPSVAIELGDLSVDLDLRGNGVRAAERALDSLCTELMSDPAVRLQIAERLNELANTITVADSTVQNSINEIGALELSMQASKKMADELRFARGGRTSLIRGHQGPSPDPHEVSSKAKDFAQMLASSEQENVYWSVYRMFSMCSRQTVSRGCRLAPGGKIYVKH